MLTAYSKVVGDQVSNSTYLSRHIRFRVTDKELNALAAVASSQRVTRSTVLRNLLQSLQASTKVETPISG